MAGIFVKSSGSLVQAASIPGPAGQPGPEGPQGPEGSASTAQVINAQTGTSYTLVAEDAGKMVTLSNTSPITLNAPGSVFAAGQRVDVVVINTGMATVVGTSGATANGTPSLTSRARWSAFTILWTSAISCVVVGDLA